MSIILGINAYHADSSACIIVNGKLIAAIEEERLNRKKHFAGYPIESIKECLKIAKKDSDEITDIAFNTRPLSNLIPKTLSYIRNFSLKRNFSSKRIYKKMSIKNNILKEFKLKKNVKFHYIEHHKAHIASAFFPSKFEKANGLSIDGSGDFVTCAIAECFDNQIIIKKKHFFPHSLGIFYHGMTQFLGFKNYGEEYKMMGLAAYGNPIYYEKIINNLFEKNKNNNFKLNLDYFNHQRNDYRYIADENLTIDLIYSNKLVDLFDSDYKNSENKEIFKKNFASSVQKVYEFFFNKIIEEIISKNFSENLVFSGGCALNSTANKILTDNKKLFKKTHINYAPGDNGGAIGAALIVSAKKKEDIKNSENPYLGNEYTNKEIFKCLNDQYYKKKIEYKFIEDQTKLMKLVAQLISQGNVIGWFQGKMEFGPRALGNRSILADPRNPQMKDIINLKVKRRESYRPFAPVVLEEYQNEWFESNFFNSYMSSVVNVKKDKKALVPAITHIDNTARLQSTNKKTNEKLSILIHEFNKITKVPILLNTSFNENEPIVRKPKEALDCLIRTDIDLLIINNYVVNKIKNDQ